MQRQSHCKKCSNQPLWGQTCTVSSAPTGSSATASLSPASFQFITDINLCIWKFWLRWQSRDSRVAAAVTVVPSFIPTKMDYLFQVFEASVSFGATGAPMFLEIPVNGKGSHAGKETNAAGCLVHRDRIVDQYSNTDCGAITNSDKNELFLIRTTADGTTPMCSLKSEGPFSRVPPPHIKLECQLVIFECSWRKKKSPYNRLR